MKKIIATDTSLPLFLQVKEYILEELKEMQLESGDRIPSETVVCDKSSVSIRTVRRALAELEKDGVIIRRQGLGSFLKDIEAGSKVESRGTVGIMFSDMAYVAHPVFSELLQVIENDVLEKGYSFHLYSTGDRLAVADKRPLEQVVPLDKVVGLIATSALCKDDIQTLRRRKIPLVGFNEYRNMQVNSVIFDYYSAARLGIKYLLEAGHKKIAFICRRFSKPDSVAIFNNDNFLRGISETFAETGSIFDEKMVFQTGALRKEGREIAEKLLYGSNPPDAIFTVDDMLARGVWDVLRGSSQKCSVLSCGIPGDTDNVSWIRISAKDWGDTAVRMLFRVINGDKSVKKTKLVKPELLSIKENSKAI
jgi:DNA-binding LacI/PurR family transcriptional regulator